jgi:hypothetical protein
MRTPRRHFAAPFVVTTAISAAAAATAACGSSKPKCLDCGAPMFPDRSMSPPDAALPDAAVARPDAAVVPPDAAPPTALATPDAALLVASTPFDLDFEGPWPTRWNVYKHGKKCVVTLQPDPCPPGWRCNPPPPDPRPYKCPDGVTFERSMMIELPVGGTECVIKPDDSACFDHGANCPGPRKVRCPR